MALRTLLLSVCITVGCTAATRQPRVAPPQASRVEPLPQRTTADAAPLAPTRSAQVAHDYASPAVVRVDEREALLLAGNLRAVVFADGRVEVASALTDHNLKWAQQRTDGLWCFATDDGLVLTARSFTGAFESSQALSGPLDDDDVMSGLGAVAAATVRRGDGVWLRLDEHARATTIESDYADVATDLRFVEDRRALAVVSPNLVGLSDDGGESWNDLTTPGDVPLRLGVDDAGRTIVVGARFRWRLADGGASLVRDDARPRERSAEQALARWGAWWREHLWPTGSHLRFDPGLSVATEHRGALVAWGDDRFVVLQRDGSRREVDVPGGPLELCSAYPFGEEVLADCHPDYDAPGRLLALNPSTMALRDLAPPSTPSWFVAASDGSVIVEMAVSMSEALAWTPGHPWRRVSLPGFSAIFDGPGRATVFLADQRGAPRSVTFGADGAPTVGDLQTAEGASGRVTMVRAHDGLRTVLRHDAPNHRCAVTLERDGALVASRDVTDCDEPEEALFVDDRFGALLTRTRVLSTRDGGAHWTRQDRLYGRERVRPSDWAPSRRARIQPVREGLLIGEAHLVPRDGDADAPVWRRPPERAQNAPPPEEGRRPFTLLRCDRTTTLPTTPPSATVLLHHGARVEVGSAREGDAIVVDLRWRADAATLSGRFHGPAPWPDAALDLTARARVAYALRGASAAGVLVERCLLDATAPRENGASARCSVHWFHRAGVTEIAMQQPTRPDVGSLVELAAPDGAGWVVELSPGDARADALWSQWQHWGADHTLARWGDVRRRHASEPYYALARFGGNWGAIIGNMERPASLRFLPHAPNLEELTVERPSSLAVCTQRAAPQGDLWVDAGGLGVNLVVQGLDLGSSSLVNWAWTLALTDDGWCAVEGHSALSSHEWQDRASDRRDVAWSVRMGDAGVFRPVRLGVAYIARGAVTERSANPRERDRSRRVECNLVELGDPLYESSL